jgi:hypothetical protein
VFSEVGDPPVPSDGLVVKKGTRIFVYEAGDSFAAESYAWLALDTGLLLVCNHGVLPSDDDLLGAFVRAKDFKRIRSLAPFVPGDRRQPGCEAASRAGNAQYEAAALAVVDLRCGANKESAKVMMRTAGRPRVVRGSKGEIFTWKAEPLKLKAATRECSVSLKFRGGEDDARMEAALVLCVTSDAPDSWGEVKQYAEDLYSLRCP